GRPPRKAARVQRELPKREHPGGDAGARNREPLGLACLLQHEVALLGWDWSLVDHELQILHRAVGAFHYSGAQLDTIIRLSHQYHGQGCPQKLRAGRFQRHGGAVRSDDAAYHIVVSRLLDEDRNYLPRGRLPTVHVDLAVDLGRLSHPTALEEQVGLLAHSLDQDRKRPPHQRLLMHLADFALDSEELLLARRLGAGG